jgi:CheY-like chemotaxis protein
MPKVLIVDDDTAWGKAVATYLGNHGHTVDRLADGQAAIATLGAKKPDVVVLDVRMPGMNGITLLEVIRSYPKWANLPVIVLSGVVTEEQAKHAKELGVRYVLQKTDSSLKELGAAVNVVTGVERPA